MPKFLVRYVEGASSRGEDRSVFVGPSRETYMVEATGRANAYIMAYQYFKEQGHDVSVVAVGEASSDKSRPLGFSDEELRIIRDAHIPVDAEFPNSGVQIEEIVPDE
jgi:hypothetical protein